jgi:serine/threonine protein kinase
VERERWLEIERLYDAAQERDASERAQFLDEACVGDESLRQEVERLLAQGEGTESFLGKPALEVAAQALARDQAAGTTAPDPMLGRTVSQYCILAKLGEGGMGEVYRARDSKLGRDVALKVLPEAFAQHRERMARFQREARLLASLNHPNIAAIYGLEESSGVHALAMELIEGPTLGELIAAEPMPIGEALPIARQIAEALEFAHERGIVHRDLKPANIKLTQEHQVKILDSGLAKALEGEASQADVAKSPTLTAQGTQAGMILGTAGYMSPEQAKGKSVDRRADIWAFGCVLYEMLTGKQAFESETVSEVIAAVLKTEPDLSALPAGTPARVQNLVRRCLEKDPKRRLQAIGEARIAIEETISGAPDTGATLAAAPGRAPGPPLQPWRQALPWAIAAAATVAAFVFAILAARNSLQPKTEESIIRFSASPPENAPFHSLGGFMSLSPDGRSLAFVTEPSAPTPSLLWVRSLDSLTARLLEGTDGAAWPFWSPDSRYLGFYADGKLKKVDVSGGPVQTLCDAGGEGATWNQDGLIVFTHHGYLDRVPEAGGAPTLVGEPDTTRYLAYRFPQFLPDGRHFLFQALDQALIGGGQAVSIMVGSLDSKETTRLLGANSNALYTAPGYLLYLRQGALMAGRFDTKRLRFTADAVPVAERVGLDLPGAYAFFSVSLKGVLAYQTIASGALDQMVWFDRKGAKLGSIGPAGVYTNPDVSPDGAKLAVGLVDPKLNTRDIWVYDLKRGTGSRLTFDPADDLNPVWSPDGSRIMFTSNRKGQRDIYEQPANGLGSAESVFESKQQTKSLNDWSPDGRYAIYDTSGGVVSLWALPLFGQRTPSAFIQGNFAAGHARFSPHGKFVAYASEETGRWEVYVRTFPEQQGKWQVSNSGGTEPMWRRDGKELFYIGPENEIIAVEVKTDSAHFEAGISKPLFKAPITAAPARNRYVVSPDGQRFLMIVPLEQGKASPITVVVNWPALLEKK